MKSILILVFLLSPIQFGMDIKHPLFVDTPYDIVCCYKKHGKYRTSRHGCGCIAVPKQDDNFMCVCKCKKGKAACFCYDFNNKKKHYYNW